MADSYVVGIDLGTTNIVVAYAPVVDNQAGTPQVLGIGQWESEGVWRERQMLPAYRFHSTKNLPQMPFPLQPLPKDFPAVFGVHALELGALHPGQGVASAKSWLSQASLVHRDAQDQFLPWGIGDDLASAIGLVSPVMASASYLNYVTCWWNAQFPQHPLQDQTVTVTVPASFDDYARDLTRAAAEMTGLQVFLLEEPTAAAYAWMQSAAGIGGSHREPAQSHMKQAGIMCVLDVGGGTTDLSLIDFRNPSAPRRLAVGDHLMLGGDNVDTAIAHQAFAKLKEAHPGLHLSPARWSSLMLSARDLKERLFQSQCEALGDTLTLSFIERGRSLVKQQRQTRFDAQILRTQLIEGFFPTLEFDSPLDVNMSSYGIVEMGLKYEQDPAISRHLLRFLRDAGHRVDSVLLNGGLFQSPAFEARIRTQFQQWSDEAWNGHDIAVFKTANPQTAVATGALSFSEMKRRQSSDDPAKPGAVIGGGAPRWLFLQVDGEDRRAVCVVEKGMEEGCSFVIDQIFKLVVNQPVQFAVYTAMFSEARVGDLVSIDPRWVQLPVMQTQLTLNEATHESEVETQEVRLVTALSEVGALQLRFKSPTDHQIVTDALLEFAGRAALVGQRIDKALLPRQWPAIRDTITQLYGPKRARADASDKSLFVQWRSQLDSVGSRQQWDVTFCRCLTDTLLMYQKNRRRSAKHESQWLALVAFGLRPGYGVVGDEHRIDLVRQALDEGPAYHEYEVWNAWWTLVRRCAPALSQQDQWQIFTTHEQKIKTLVEYLQHHSSLKRSQSSAIKPAARAAGKKNSKANLSKKEQDLKNRAPDALLRAVASLDRLRGKTWFESALWPLLGVDALGVNSKVIAWCCGVMVQRYPLNPGCPDFTPVPRAQVHHQLLDWLTMDWQACPELGLASSLAVQKHPDATIELTEADRQQVLNRLRACALPDSWQASIVQPQSSHGLIDALAGDGLPHGLTL